MPLPLWLAATYAAKFAVIAIDRSMPAVSMHRVWLAAKMANGQASNRIDRTPRTVKRLSSCRPVMR